MKKIITIILLFLIFPINISAISASSYVVLDQNSNKVLMGSNYNEEALIASITKIVTAIVVIENIDISKKITVDEEVLKAYGSAIYLEIGEVITIEDLLYGLMLRSGNDAAIVLANNVAGSMEEFSTLMNKLVKDLLLENTNFVNAHGLDNDETANYSSAYDMGVLMNYAMKNSTFKKITGTLSYNTESSYKTYSWYNKNRLLTNYKYATGGKTGYTQKANRTLITTASKDNMDITIVTLNDGNDFEDHEKLYEIVFDNYEAIKVLDKEITSLKNSENNFYIKNDYYALVKDDRSENLEVKYSYYNKVIGSIAGKVEVLLDNQIIYKDNIYINKEENTGKLKLYINKIIKWFKSW